MVVSGKYGEDEMKKLFGTGRAVLLLTVISCLLFLSASSGAEDGVSAGRKINRTSKRNMSKSFFTR